MKGSNGGSEAWLVDQSCPTGLYEASETSMSELFYMVTSYVWVLATWNVASTIEILITLNLIK